MSCSMLYSDIKIFLSAFKSKWIIRNLVLQQMGVYERAHAQWRTKFWARGADSIP